MQIMLKPKSARELLGWVVILLGVGSLQLPGLGRMAQHAVSIMQLEMMRTTPGATRLLDQLGNDGIGGARQQLYVDFFFLVAYAVVLSTACVMLARRAGAGWVAGAGPIFGRLAVVAAACDAVENIALLVVLGNHPGQPWPGLATGFATVKFALLGLVAAYLVLGGVATIRREHNRASAAQD